MLLQCKLSVNQAVQVQILDVLVLSGRFAALIRFVEVLSSRSSLYTGARPRFEDTLDAHWMVEPSNRPDQS